jgi:S1-C subfamily serine protease
LADGKTVEPLLTYDENLSSNKKPIQDQFSASGVLVSNDGFILTSHHVAAAWETPYRLLPDSGILVDSNYNDIGRISLKDSPDYEWIPSETQQDIFQDQKRKVKGGKFNGANDRLSVSFPGSTEGNNGRQVKASESYDVAMIKVDLPGTLPKAELYDSLDSARQGDNVFVMGYPFSSLSVSGSKREIPEPTISAGNIGKLIRTQEKSRRQVAYSKIGDAYQLSVNTSDNGYDGAPVFDDRGRVIGIFNLNKNVLDAPVTIAVPIRYAIELMSVTPAK